MKKLTEKQIKEMYASRLGFDSYLHYKIMEDLYWLDNRVTSDDVESSLNTFLAFDINKDDFRLGAYWCSSEYSKIVLELRSRIYSLEHFMLDLMDSILNKNSA